MNPNNHKDVASVDEGNIPGAIHEVMALKSLVNALKTNPAILPHVIGLANSLDIVQLSKGAFASDPNNNCKFMNLNLYRCLHSLSAHAYSHSTCSLRPNIRFYCSRSVNHCAQRSGKYESSIQEG